MEKVTVQSQEWRTEDETGNEVFGETLYLNGVPMDTEQYGEVSARAVLSVFAALNMDVEVLPDLEPMELLVGR